MRQAIFLILLFASISGTAQMNRLFYGNEWKDLTALTDSIKSVLPGFTVDSTAASKSGKSETLFLKDSAGGKLEVNVVKFSQEVDRIGTVQITGQKEAVYNIYKAFINPGLQNGGSPSLVVARLPTGQSMPIAIFENRAKKDSWVLVSRTAN